MIFLNLSWKCLLKVEKKRLIDEIQREIAGGRVLDKPEICSGDWFSAIAYSNHKAKTQSV